jgi:predicted glutamine amidotransferase
MPGVLGDSRFAPAWNFPLGETDSEWSFCALMDRLRRALAPDEVLNVPKKLPVIQNWANELAQGGTANFLLSDSEYLYAHCSTRLFYIERQCLAPRELFGSASLRVALEPAQDGTQHVSLIATQPLTTDEAWLALPAGEVVVFHRGRRIF